MQNVRFRNGADAPEIMLAEQFDTAAEARSRLRELARMYGTVPDAVAWLDGDEGPAFDEPEPEPEPEPELEAVESDEADEAEEPSEDDGLHELTVKELDDLAEEEGIDLPSGLVKSEKVDAIRAARAASDEPELE